MAWYLNKRTGLKWDVKDIEIIKRLSKDKDYEILKEKKEDKFNTAKSTSTKSKAIIKK